MNFRDLQESAWEVNHANGWNERWDEIKDTGTVPVAEHIISKLALVMTEAAEAIEDVRVGKLNLYHTINGRQVYPVTDGSGADWTTEPDGATPPTATTYTGVQAKPEGLPSELADVVIRVMSLAETLEIDLAQIILEKITYNATRGSMHGGKVA